jgi:hypothetical protein
MKRTIGLLAALLVMWLSVPASAQTPGWFSRVNIGSTTGTYCTILRGAGSPEGVVTGGVCDVYLRTDGAAGTVIYVKESGTGNTGWRAQPLLAATSGQVVYATADNVFGGSDDFVFVDGKIGVGTAAPQVRMHFAGVTAATSNVRFQRASTGIAAVIMEFFKSRGTLASPTPTQSEDLFARIDNYGMDSGNVFRNGVRINIAQDGAAGADFVPGRFELWTASASATLVERLRIASGGQILTGAATQVTSAGTGDVILPNNTGELRAVNAAGTDTYPLIGSNASNQVSVASGGAATILGGALSIPGDVTQDAVLLISSTAPTIGSGFGTSPSVAGARTAAFTVNVGTGGTASSGVLTMPTATTGWNCHVENRTAVAANAADQRTVQTATTTTSVTVQNQTISTGAALAWTASDVLAFLCMAY